MRCSDYGFGEGFIISWPFIDPLIAWPFIEFPFIDPLFMEPLFIEPLFMEPLFIEPDIEECFIIWLGAGDGAAMAMVDSIKKETRAAKLRIMKTPAERGYMQPMLIGRAEP